MTHIGYIYYIFKDKGIVIDAHRTVHAFIINSDYTFHDYQFVTFEGEGDVVTDVIPLESYPTYYIYHNMNFYIQSLGWGYNLINKQGERYKLQDAEEFIVDRIFKKMPLEPVKIDIFCKEEYHRKVKEIVKTVSFVSTHLQDIADSYKVEVKNWYLSKIGGDDSAGTKVKVDLCYRDDYISKFFMQSGDLFSERSCSVDLRSPYKDGRQPEIEEHDKEKFLKEYDKKDHYSALTYSLYKETVLKTKMLLDLNYSLGCHWGIWEGDEHWQNAMIGDITLDVIRRINQRGMSKSD